MRYCCVTSSNSNDQLLRDPGEREAISLMHISSISIAMIYVLDRGGVARVAIIYNPPPPSTKCSWASAPVSHSFRAAAYLVPYLLWSQCSNIGCSLSASHVSGSHHWKAAIRSVSHGPQLADERHRDLQNVSNLAANKPNSRFVQISEMRFMSLISLVGMGIDDLPLFKHVIKV